MVVVKSTPAFAILLSNNCHGLLAEGSYFEFLEEETVIVVLSYIKICICKTFHKFLTSTSRSHKTLPCCLQAHAQL